MRETKKCPKCGCDAARDEVDVEVGIIYGPWGCFCGWCENAYYDSTQGESQAQRDHPDFIIDTLGGMRRR